MRARARERGLESERAQAQLKTAQAGTRWPRAGARRVAAARTVAVAISADRHLRRQAGAARAVRSAVCRFPFSQACSHGRPPNGNLCPPPRGLDNVQASIAQPRPHIRVVLDGPKMGVPASSVAAGGGRRDGAWVPASAPQRRAARRAACWAPEGLTARRNVGRGRCSAQGVRAAAAASC